jgi:small subunit ribosomal protein S24e
MSGKGGKKGGKAAAAATDAAAKGAKKAAPHGQACHIRTRKALVNKLLGRKQMLVDVSHFGRPSVPKAELRTKIAKMFKVKDEQLVVVFGFSHAFGGGKSTGFCLIYESLEALKKFEPRHRQVRQGLLKKKEGSAKQKKEKKNRYAGAHVFLFFTSRLSSHCSFVSLAQSQEAAWQGKIREEVNAANSLTTVEPWRPSWLAPRR